MDNRIKVIRGDMLQIFFKIESITDFSVVQAVHFSCAKQAIDVVLAYDEEKGGYYLNLSSEQTAELTACSGLYDLTIVLTSGNSLTVIHNAPFVVWEKENEIL